MMKKFIADPSFWELFPGAAVGVLSVAGVNEAAQLPPEQAEEVAELLKAANAVALARLDEGVPLSQNRPVAVWREAYQKFPTKKGARCSIEALLKRVSKGEPVGTIAPTVDLTNAISLKYALPIGAEDLDAFDGDLHLGVMAGGEDFLPIGADQPDPPRPGELACALLHELTHFKRRDIWLKTLALWVKALYWFNPLSWIMYRLIGRDTELAFDKEALGLLPPELHPVYGQAILSAAARLNAPPSLSPPSP